MNYPTMHLEQDENGEETDVMVITLQDGSQIRTLFTTHMDDIYDALCEICPDSIDNVLRDYGDKLVLARRFKAEDMESEEENADYDYQCDLEALAKEHWREVYQFLGDYDWAM